MKPVRQSFNTTNYDPTILIHPNIPKPLHGLNPRTIMGSELWQSISNNIRGSTNHCQACGVSKFISGSLDCHEEYRICYEAGTSTFVRYVAICKLCHDFIHCGRIKALVRAKKITRSYFVKVMTHGRVLLRKHKLKRIKHRGEVAPWNKWRLIFEGKEYKTLYKNYEDWKQKYINKR